MLAHVDVPTPTHPRGEDWVDADFELGADLFHGWLVSEVSVVRVLERYRSERVILESERRAWRETTFFDADQMRVANQTLIWLVTNPLGDITSGGEALAAAAGVFHRLERQIWQYWLRHPEPRAASGSALLTPASLVLHLCRSPGWRALQLDDVREWAESARITPPDVVGLPLLRSAVEDARDIDRALDQETASATAELA